MIKISKGNSKLGPAIPNVSLIPIKDCGNCSACSKSCYALKAWKQYKLTRAAWSSNSRAFRADPFVAATNVIMQLEKKRVQPRFFRIHVAGDFLNQDHVDAWMMVARALPNIKFLAFTKMWALNYSAMPDNVKIVHSMWPGMPDNAPKRPGTVRAWVQDGTEKRIPADALECPGNCASCGACWSIDKDVYFNVH